MISKINSRETSPSPRVAGGHVLPHPPPSALPAGFPDNLGVHTPNLSSGSSPAKDLGHLWVMFYKYNAKIMGHLSQSAHLINFGRL